MPDLWYYGKNEQRLGPVPLKELQRLVSSRDLEATDLVWSPGMADWTPAAEVEGLFSKLASAAASSSAAPSRAEASPPITPTAQELPVGEDRWHYEDQGERRGPVSIGELKQLATSGQIHPESLVWKRGMADWSPASEVDGLFPVQAEPANDSTDLWYYGDGEQRHGPVSMDELKAIASSGQLQQNHLVWKRGMAEWTVAAEVKELSSVHGKPSLRSESSTPQTTREPFSPPVPAPSLKERVQSIQAAAAPHLSRAATAIWRLAAFRKKPVVAGAVVVLGIAVVVLLLVKRPWLTSAGTEPLAGAKDNQADVSGQEPVPVTPITPETKAAVDKAANKLAAEKVAADKTAAEKALAEKVAAEKLAVEKAAAEKALAAQKAAADKIAAEKAAADRIASAKALAEKVAAEKALAAQKVASEKAAADKIAAEKAAADKIAAEKALVEKKAAAEKVAAEKALAEMKVVADKLAAQRAAAEKIAAEKIAAEKAAAAKIAAEKAASEKVAAEKAAAEKKAKPPDLPDEIWQAQQTLGRNPTDAAANLAVGRYLCFDKGQWAAGLPMLARSSDAKLKVLAAADLKGGTSTDEVVRLGNAWWEFARDKTGIEWRSSQKRAVHWYRQATGQSRRELKERFTSFDRLPDAFEIISRRTNADADLCTVHCDHLSLAAQRTEKMPERAGLLAAGVAGLELKGVRFLELKVKASPESGGKNKNMFAGFMVDYQTAKGYTKRMALSIGPFNRNRAARLPRWGRDDVPDDYVDLGRKDSYQLDLQKWAPPGWTGQVWIVLTLQQRTPGAFLKAELIPRATSGN